MYRQRFSSNHDSAPIQSLLPDEKTFKVSNSIHTSKSANPIIDNRQEYESFNFDYEIKIIESELNRLETQIYMDATLRQLKVSILS